MENSPDSHNHTPLRSSSGAEASPPPVSSSVSSTSALSRDLGDLHVPTWLGLIASSALVRTTLQHPLNVGLSRKRIATTNPSLRTILSDAFAAPMQGCVCGPATRHGAACDLSRTQRRLQGVRNVYRGFGAAAVGNMLGESCYLVTVEAVRFALAGGSTSTVASSSPTSSSDRHSTGSEAADGGSAALSHVAAQARTDAVAGMSGEVISMLLCTPLSVACNRQMTAGYGLNAATVYQPLPATMRAMWHTHASASTTAAGTGAAATTGVRAVSISGGLRGWYPGLSASVAMLPASGIWWATYGLAKRAAYAVAGPYLDAAAATYGGGPSTATTACQLTTPPHQHHHSSAPHAFHLSRSAATGCHCNDPAGCPQCRAELAQLEARLLGRPTAKQQQQHPAGDAPLPPSSAAPHISSSSSSSVSNVSVPWYLSSADNVFINGLCGAFATALTTIVYSPVSIVRTRLQAVPATGAIGCLGGGGPPITVVAGGALRHRLLNAVLCRSRAVAVLADLLRTEGWRGLFKGASVNITASVVDGLLFSSMYELTKLGSDQSTATSTTAAAL